MKNDPAPPMDPDSRGPARGGRLFALAVLLLVLAGTVVRLAGLDADPPPDLSWSHAPFTDGAVVVHDARNRALYGEWILDACKDVSLFPLSNLAAYASFRIAGVGRAEAALPNVLFAALSTLAVAVGIAAAAGTGAALLWTALISFNYLIIMFQRIPLAEPAMLFLLSLSFLFFALARRHRWAPYLCGFFAVAAPLFGKAHAFYFPLAVVAALAAARASRGANALPVRPFLAGGAAAALLWLATLYPAYGGYIRAHWAVESYQKNEGGLAAMAVEAPRNFLHMGVHTDLVRRLSLSLALAFLGLLGLCTEERGRFRDTDPSVLLLFFWLVSGWTLVSAVHGPAPRYLFPLVFPLLYFAARPVLRLWGGEAIVVRLPSGRSRTVLGAAVLFMGLYQLLGSIGGRVLDSLGASARGRVVYDFFVRKHEYAEIIPFLFTWTVITASIAFAALFTLRRSFPVRFPLPHARGRPLAVVLVLAAVLIGLAPWAGWRARATHGLRDASRDLGDWLGPGACLMGPYAPALGLDNRVRVIPYVGGLDEPDVFRKYGVTHVVIASRADDIMIRDKDPEVHSALEMVLYYPIRTKYSDRMVVYRVPSSVGGKTIHAYEPGPFERALDALKQNDLDRALRLFREFADEHPENADGHYMIGVVLDRLGRHAESEPPVRAATLLRPERALYLQKLGTIVARLGRADDARDLLEEALLRDPSDATTRALLEKLVPPDNP